MITKGEKVVYTKNDIAMGLSDSLGISKAEATASVNGVFDVLAEIVQQLNPGDEIKIGNIGVISARMSKPGDRRNPRTQEIIHVESKKNLKFRTLPKFKAALNDQKLMLKR